VAEGKVIAISGSEREDSNTDFFLNIVLENAAKDGMETELIQLRDKTINGCIYDQCKAHCGYQHPPHWLPKYDKCYQSIGKNPDDFWPIFEKMCAADAIVLGSPCYFGSATPKIKAIIDRAGICGEARGHYIRYLKDPEDKRKAQEVLDKATPEERKIYENGQFYRKVGAAVCVTRRTGANFTLAQMQFFFGICNMIQPGSCYWNMSVGGALGYRISKGEYQDDEAIEIHTILGENIAWLVKQLKK
jgi:multimeric flavodoxin WrbA